MIDKQSELMSELVIELIIELIIGFISELIIKRNSLFRFCFAKSTRLALCKGNNYLEIRRRRPLARLNVNPTRMEMQRLKKLLKTAMRGHKLLKDKLDELMKRFLETAREAQRLRSEAEAALNLAYRSYAITQAEMSRELIGEALLIPAQKISVTADQKNEMGVFVPVFGFKTEGQSAQPYGFAFTSSELDNAVLAFSKALPLLLALAQAEKNSQLMAKEIERTHRRVNALENIMIPNYSETIRFIVMKLEENDRGSKVRLMKVKDQMIEKTIKAANA